jgi:hypothetical protein
MTAKLPMIVVATLLEGKFVTTLATYPLVSLYSDQELHYVISCHVRPWAVYQKVNKANSNVEVNQNHNSLSSIQRPAQTPAIYKSAKAFHGHYWSSTSLSSPFQLPLASSFVSSQPVPNRLENISPSLRLIVPRFFLSEPLIEANSVPAADQAPKYTKTATDNDQAPTILIARLL